MGLTTKEIDSLVDIVCPKCATMDAGYRAILSEVGIELRHLAGAHDMKIMVQKTSISKAVM